MALDLISKEAGLSVREGAILQGALGDLSSGCSVGHGENRVVEGDVVVKVEVEVYICRL